jgi:hypothetical protein
MKTNTMNPLKTNSMYVNHHRSLLRDGTLALLAGALILTGCRKDEEDPMTPAPPVNEEELITTVRLTFNTASFAEYKYMTFTDVDGPGGQAPVITADTLSADSIYDVNIEVLDESVTPAEDITAEILAEGAEHQFFFAVTGADLTFAYSDADANGLPIGLLSACFVGAPGAGALTVTLRHEPDKTAPGVEAGDITNAGGETDIEVTFPVVVD